MWTIVQSGRRLFRTLGFYRESFHRHVAARHCHRVTHGLFSGCLETHLRATLPTPSTLDRCKDARLVLNDFLLLFGSQLHHSVAVVGAAQCGEDLAVNTEIRMPHMGVL